MDVLASYSIFQELQLVHDTGYFSALPSLEETWQQVTDLNYLCKSCGGGGLARGCVGVGLGLNFFVCLFNFLPPFGCLLLKMFSETVICLPLHPPPNPV